MSDLRLAGLAGVLAGAGAAAREVLVFAAGFAAEAATLVLPAGFAAAAGFAAGFIARPSEAFAFSFVRPDAAGADARGAFAFAPPLPVAFFIVMGGPPLNREAGATACAPLLF